MLETVIITVLAISLVLACLGAVAAILWMRQREQQRDEVLARTDSLEQLDNALNDALKELNRVGNLVQKEIAEKYQAMLFLYNMLEEKEKARATEETVPGLIAVPDVEPIVAAPPAPVKKKRATKATTAKAAPEAPDTKPAPAKPPRKNANNAKHKKVQGLFAQGISTADIAKELGMSVAEVALIIELLGSR